MIDHGVALPCAAPPFFDYSNEIFDMIRYMLFTLLFCLSCASRQTRNMEYNYLNRVGYRQMGQLDSLHDRSFREHWQSASVAYRETVTFVPSGSFTYHPDSGYRGSAARVEVRREGVRSERRATRDSSGQSRYVSAVAIDSLSFEQSRELQHSDTRRSPWHWWIAALPLLALGVFAYRRLCR